MIELRYVYDCENMEKVLEYRQLKEGNPVTPWTPVPTVLKLGPDDYKDPKEYS